MVLGYAQALADRDENEDFYTKIVAFTITKEA